MVFDSLSDDDKLAILNQVIAQAENEIYRYCLIVGINPDTLDPATYTFSVPVERPEAVSLKHSCDTLLSARARLS